MVVRNLVIGLLAYGVATIANPDASTWRTLAIALAIIALMFLDDVWKAASGY